MVENDIVVIDSSPTAKYHHTVPLLQTEQTGVRRQNAHLQLSTT